MNPIEAASPEEAHTWDVLLEVGCHQVPNALSSGGTGLKLKHGGLELEVVQCIGQRFAEIVFITGIYRDARQLSQIGFELPLRFESKLHALAVLAYSLGDHFQGKESSAPEWLQLGLKNENLLPWRIEEAAYAARPHCVMDRDFARLMRARLRDFLDSCPDESTVTFGFDGNSQTVSFSGKPLSIPAEGEAWPGTYTVQAKTIQKLPTRFNSPQIVVGIWEENLCLANWRYPLFSSLTGWGKE